ncbi:MAG: hypothetical protein KAZ26_05895 [Caldilineaceae bacterium]|nr:hypothetical protein [Caldilineaceae bacterium]
MAQSTSANSAVKIDLAQLANFIDELRESGYNIGIGQYLAAQDLLLSLYPRIDPLQEPARLKLMLGPLLCTSPSEQAEFPHRFDQWLSQIDAQRLFVSRPADYQANLNELEQIELSASRWRIALRLAIILLVLVVIGEGADPSLGRHGISEEINAVTENIESSPQPTPGAQQAAPVINDNGAPYRDIELSYKQLLLVGLLAVLVYVARRLWWRYQAQRFLDRYSANDSPTIHHLRVQRGNSVLFAPLQLSDIARDFRKRTDEPSSSVDILRTVDKTLRSGGWLTPVYRRRQAFPEYLMLVDRVSLRDHQSHYIAELITLLQEQGVFTTVLYFDGDPRRCVPQNEQEPPLSLDEVTAKYNQHRLVLFTDARALFDPLTGQPEPWLDMFSNLPDRALLTPVPVMHWGYREQTLATWFIVLPATTDGLSVLVEQLRRGQQAEALMAERKPPLPPELQYRPLRWLEREPPPPPLVERILLELKEYLGYIGYTWLCACAVYPGLDWNLTLFLGNAVSGATRAQQLASERVLDLARLPWFRYGYMPDWLRILLIGSLPGESEQRIRRSLDALLISAIQGGDDSFALEIAQSKSPLILRLGRSLHQLLGQKREKNSPLQEHVYMNFMAGRKRQLAVQLPQSLAKALFTHRFFQDTWRLGLRWFGANVLGYIGLFLLVFILAGLGVGELNVLSWLLLGIASGAILGICQWLAIRNHIPVSRSWIWVTTAGAVLVTASLGIIGSGSGWYILAALISQCLIIPLFQATQFRPFTPNARGWVWVNAGGWMLGGFGGVLVGVPILVLPVLGALGTLGTLGMGAAVFAISIGVYSWTTGRYLYQVTNRIDPFPLQHKASSIIEPLSEPPVNMVETPPDRERVLWRVLAPGLLCLALLYGWPVAGTIYYSFQEYSLISSAQFIGLENYTRLITDSLTWTALGNTLGSGLWQFLPVYLVWLVLNYAWRRQRIVPIWVVVLAVLPIPFLSPAGSAILWAKLVFGMDPIGRTISFSSTSQAPQLMFLIEMLHTLSIAAVVGLLLYGLSQHISRRSNVDSFHPTLRNAGMIIAIVANIQSFHWRFVITQGGPSNSTMSLLHYIYNQSFMFLRMGYGAAVSVIVLIPIGVLAYFVWRWFGRVQPRLVLVKSSPGTLRPPLGLLMLSLVPTIVIFSPYILAPFMIANLIPTTLSEFMSGIGQIFSQYPMLRWIFNSAPLGLTALLVQLPLSLGMAYVTSVRWPLHSTRRRLILLPFYLAAMLSMGVMALPLFLLLRNLGWVNTLYGAAIPTLFSGIMVIVFVYFFDGQQPAIANARQAGQTRMSFFLGNLLPSLWPLIWTVGALAAQFAIQQLYWPLITLNSVQSQTVGVGMVSANAQATGNDLYSGIYSVYAGVLPFAIPCALILIWSVPRLIRNMQLQTNQSISGNNRMFNETEQKK